MKERLAMELQTMHYAVEGRIGHVTLNRPHVLNAMNGPWAEDFLRVGETLARDSQVALVIISGAGRAFSSGIDLKALSQREIPLEWFRTFERALRTFETMDKLIIAAIHGYCIGGGLQVVLACDIRIASEGSQFGLTAVKECLVPGMGTLRLPRYIGMGRAKRLILSGEMISAQEASVMGLVDYVVSEQDFGSRVREIAAACLQAASEGQRQSKQLVNVAFDLEWEAFLEKYMQGQAKAMASPQHQEAMLAYRQKREPAF